jgi:hypothetical protein
LLSVKKNGNHVYEWVIIAINISEDLDHREKIEVAFVSDPVKIDVRK